MYIVEQEKIRIRLRAYDHNILDTSCKKIIDVLKQEENIQYSLVPLPTRRSIYCVLRSPHVNKDAREHFEIRTHQRIFDLYKPSAKIVTSLTKLDLPAGIDVEIKI